MYAVRTRGPNSMHRDSPRPPTHILNAAIVRGVCWFLGPLPHLTLLRNLKSITLDGNRYAPCLSIKLPGSSSWLARSPSHVPPRRPQPLLLFTRDSLSQHAVYPSPVCPGLFSRKYAIRLPTSVLAPATTALSVRMLLHAAKRAGGSVGTASPQAPQEGPTI
jgi:hypothetical protein